jgi:hypothetical protein
MPLPRRHRRRYLAVLGLSVAAVVLLAGLAVAGSHDSHRPADPPSPLEATGKPMNVGGPIVQPGVGLPLDEAIGQVLARPGMAPMTKISVVHAPVSGADANLPWLTIDVTTDSPSKSGQLETTWLAALAEGAIAELHHTDETATNQVIGGDTINAVLPNTTVARLDGGEGYVATGQTFSASDLTDDQIIRSASATLQQFHLKPVDIHVLRPLAPALYVVVQLPNATGDPGWTLDELRHALTGTPVAYEGTYIEIQSPNGDPLIAGGTAYRAGLGGLWFAHGQDDRFGASHG